MLNRNTLVFSFRAVVSFPHLITVTPGQQGIWIVFSDYQVDNANDYAYDQYLSQRW